MRLLYSGASQWAPASIVVTMPGAVSGGIPTGSANPVSSSKVAKN